MTHKVLYVSRELYDLLREGTSDPTGRVRMNVETVYGMRVHICDFLPTKSQKRELVTTDQFATYDKSDADWAVPLGLAKWETRTEECHAMCVDQPCASPVFNEFGTAISPFTPPDYRGIVKLGMI